MSTFTHFFFSVNGITSFFAPFSHLFSSDSRSQQGTPPPLLKVCCSRLTPQTNTEKWVDRCICLHTSSGITQNLKLKRAQQEQVGQLRLKCLHRKRRKWDDRQWTAFKGSGCVQCAHYSLKIILFGNDFNQRSQHKVYLDTVTFSRHFCADFNLFW